jgi:DNA/RNA-binding domain of Phe-tRNA-synthetase-like protein
MLFRHSSELWRAFPQLVAGVLYVDGVGKDTEVDLTAYNASARAKLAGGTEGELAEIQAWRRTFSRLGLKPTQYRCAAESLLRRFRKEGELPRIHPLVDLCNAVSAAYAIPVAVLDVDRIAMPLEVRYATGDEQYLAFSGELENPTPGEVVFADAAGRAHARRWTNRQSAESAVSGTTSRALIVAEALHDTAAEDVRDLVATLNKDLSAVSAILSADSPEFTAP